MPNPSNSFFWLRPGTPVPFPGVPQSCPDSCVFASIAGAINYLDAAASISESDLLADWQNDGCPPVDFNAPLGYALKRSNAVFEHRQVTISANRLTEKGIDEWLSGGGVVIASLEIVPSPPQLPGHGTC